MSIPCLKPSVIYMIKTQILNIASLVQCGLLHPTPFTIIPKYSPLGSLKYRSTGFPSVSPKYKDIPYTKTLAHPVPLAWNTFYLTFLLSE